MLLGRYIHNAIRTEQNKNLLKGMCSVLGATGLDAICRLIVVMILVRYYSKEAFGVWAAITSVAAIVVTGDFGIINALRNKISLLLVEEKRADWRMLWAHCLPR